MPTLNWIGKDNIINYDQKVEYKVLKKMAIFNKKIGN